MGQDVNSASDDEEMPAMYVRNVPEQFLRVVRATAALRGQSMRAFVLEAVREKLEREGVEVPEDEELEQ